MTEHSVRFIRGWHVLHLTDFKPNIADGGVSDKLSTVTESNSLFTHAELSNSGPIHAVQFQKD